MSKKISITIQAKNPTHVETFLRALTGVLRACPGLTVTIKTTDEVTIESSEQELDLAALGIDATPPELPIEREIRRARTV